MTDLFTPDDWDRIVERVVERVEDRVVDELARRGRRPDGGIF